MKDSVRHRCALFSVVILTTALGMPPAFGATGTTDASVVIVSPRHGETHHDNTGRLAVRLAINRPFSAIRVVLDGNQHGDLQMTHTFTLQNVHRGEHRLQVQLLDWSSNMLEASEPVVFYMWQASKRFPSRKQ